MTTPIDQATAELMARDWIAREVAPLLSDVAVDLDKQRTREVGLGWIFFYESTPAIETGDAGERIFGTSPLLVERETGDLHVLATAETIETQLERLGDYRASQEAEIHDEPEALSDARAHRAAGSWPPTERSLVLAWHAALDGVARTLEGTGDETSLAEARELLAEVEGAYLEGLKPWGITRSPVTGEVVGYVIDVGGIDGLWWRHDNPVRPDERWPVDTIGVTGALRLADAVETTPHEVRPGPDAPSVRADLLRDPDVVAVLSSFAVGPHTAYLTAYFAQNAARLRGTLEPWATGASDETGERDHDLAPWIDSQRLLWIAPGDPDLTVRRGLEGCPFIGVSGSARRQIVRDGGVDRAD